MRRQVQRSVLLKKGGARRASRGMSTSSKSGLTLYEKVVSRGGVGKVCVVRRVGGIGDVLMVTPALRQLKKDFPSLHITYAIDMHTTGNNVYYELMKNAPFVDSLVDARFVQHGSYDAVVDVSSVCLRFERSDLPPINRVDLFGRAMGVRHISDRCSWYKPLGQELAIADLLYAPHKALGKRIVVLHTASMEEKRCWPIEKYVSLVERALVDKFPVVFVALDFNNKLGSWSKYSNCIDASNTNVREMSALISEADFFVGPDSGPMHIAGAVGTKSFVIFGSVPPAARINYYPTHEGIVLKGLSCLGCWYKPCPYSTKCMKELDYMVVYKKLTSGLELQ